MGTVNSCCAGLRKENNDQETIIDAKSVRNSKSVAELTNT